VPVSDGSSYSVQFPIEEKPAEELERVRETSSNRILNRSGEHHGNYDTPSEILDGAIIAGLNFNLLSDLRGCFIRGADLRGISGIEISLSGCNFRSSDFTDSEIIRCDIGSAVFDKCTLVKVDLSGTTWQSAFIRDANLSGANLSNIGAGETAKMNRSRLWGVQGTGMILERVDLSNADFSNATLDRARIDCNLTRANFHRASLKRAEVGYTAQAANFEQANLTEATLAEMSVENASFKRSNLTEASLANVAADGASFERAVLSRSDLSGAILVNTRFRGAVIADTQITEQTQFFLSGDDDYNSQQFPTLSRSRRKYCIYDPRNSCHQISKDEERKKVGPLDPVIPSYNDATAMYRLIEVLGRNSAQPSLQSIAFIRRQEAQTYQFYKDRSYVNYIYNRLSGILFQYGESISRIFAFSLLIVLSFAIIYPLGGYIEPVPRAGLTTEPITFHRILSGEVELVWASVYYSTLTFTSLGFADYRPVGFVGQLLTVIEASSGAVLIALLVFVLGRRATQ
jgi:uncharacterized protein YjbI with pentapeptide repeats